MLKTSKTVSLLLLSLALSSNGAESSESKLSQRLPERIQQQLKRHSKVNAKSRSTRSADAAFNLDDGWNYWEVMTAAFPTEMLYEIYMEEYFEELLGGYVGYYPSIKAIFPDGWYKVFDGMEHSVVNHEDVVFDDNMNIISSDVFTKEDLTYSAAKISSEYLDVDWLIPVEFTFNTDGKPVHSILNEANEAYEEVFYTYENGFPATCRYRETDLDAGEPAEWEEERFTITRDGDNKITSIEITQEYYWISGDVFGEYGDEKIDYSYDAAGNVSEIITSDYSSDGYKKRTRELFTYDSENRLLSSSTLEWDSTSGEWNKKGFNADTLTLAYDSEGRVTFLEEFGYTSAGVLDLYERTTFTYDNNGNLVEERSSYDDFVDYESKTTYEYDKDGNLSLFVYDNTDSNAVIYENGYPAYVISTRDTTIDVAAINFTAINPMAVKQPVRQKEVAIRFSGNTIQLSNVVINGTAPALALFNVKGQQVTSLKGGVNGADASYAVSGFAPGVYLAKLANSAQCVKISIK